MGNKRFMAGVQEVLAERYELLEVLGRGGMGVVYRAHDRVLDRVVAVKVLPLDRAQDPTAVARFEREALAAAALSHRNIVAVFDFGSDQETRFIVMEYLAGQSLAQCVRERGALAVEVAVDVIAQVAAALAAAHEAGIVHRDIKPANVMLNADGHVKVLDFGIARLTAGVSLTQTAMVIGSAAYLAPELCRGAPADARSDIYALGCVLYELLTGTPPFTGELPAAVVHQHLSAAPRSPRERNPAIPSSLGALCLAMLAKDPALRPQEARALVTALPAALSDPASAVETVAMPVADPPTLELPSDLAATLPLGVAGAGAAVDRTRVMPVAQPTSRSSGNRRWLALAGILLIAMALAVLALTSGSGTPGRAAAQKHHAVTRTTPTGSGTTTSADTTTNQQTATTQPTTTAQQTTSPAVLPPPPHHGPHGGGPPPGHAKKHGPGHGGGPHDH